MLLTTLLVIVVIVALLWPRHGHFEVHSFWPPKFTALEWEPVLLPSIVEAIVKILRSNKESTPANGEVPALPAPEEKSA